MNCPDEIADIMLRILQTGILQSRSEAWSGNAEKCALEADHIHNVPSLVREYAPGKLWFYWKTERPAYIKCMGGQSIYFETLWAELEPFVPKERPAEEGQNDIKRIVAEVVKRRTT